MNSTILVTDVSFSFFPFLLVNLLIWYFFCNKLTNQVKKNISKLFRCIFFHLIRWHKFHIIRKNNNSASFSY